MYSGHRPARALERYSWGRFDLTKSERLNQLGGNATKLAGVNVVNIILGRNGSGKSCFLRSLDSNMARDTRYRTTFEQISLPQALCTVKACGEEHKSARHPSGRSAAVERRGSALGAG